MMRRTWIDNGDGYTICSVYGDYVTTLSVVDSPVLNLLAYPRGAEAIHNSRCVRTRANSYRTLSPTARETNTVTRGVSRRNVWALPYYIKRAIIRTRI